MKLGIVGLPNVGKSTLFNSLTKAGAESANYPFCTIDPNVGVVTVPDERLKLLGDFYHSKKVTPAVIEFVDIAGLVKGASKGEGLGNQFLANIREVDAIVHVVRCFEDSNVIHVDGSIDPIRDIETINLELIFSDLEILERRIAKVTKTARMDKEAAKELDFLQKVKTHLEDGKMAITMEMENEDEEAWMSTYNLLTWKPVIYAANVAEGDLADDGESNSHVQAVRKYAAEQNSEIFVICAEIEEEISELDDDEKKMFLEDLGLTESGLEKLVKASYHLLGLMSFLTSGEDETRAFNYVPRSFQIFGMEFTIYGVLIAVGALLGMGLVTLEAKRNGEDQNRYLDMMLISLLVSVAGSRLFYVAFSWGFYKENLNAILDFRNGGYALYGGLLFGFLAAAVFCRITKTSFWQSADIACPGILLGQAIGRWGNFFNRESFGEYTDLPWAMQIPVSAVRSGEVSGAMRDNLLTINGISYIQVQPIFLYESLWCLLLFLLLMAMRRKKKYEGELFMIYLAGYGLGRFFFEWFRTDKLYIPGTKVGISLVISAILFAVFMPVVIIRRVMAQKRDTIRRQRKKRFLDESVKEKQMFPETSEMKPEPEIRPEMDEQVKPDVGTSPTNSKEEQ